MNFFKTSRLPFAAMALSLLSACSQSSPPQESVQADNVYFNGKLYTMDAQQPWAEAVAIKDGRFLAVGSKQDLMSQTGPNTQWIDLQGKMAIPGMTDAHFHTRNVSARIDCYPGVFKPAQLREILEYCKSKQVPGYSWLIINGLELWVEGGVDNRLVNEIFPDTPVMIKELSQHLALVNDKALEAAGISNATPDPNGGKILRDPETGKSTGLMIGVGAALLVNNVIPPYPEAVIEKHLETLFTDLLAVGVTNLQDPLVLDDTDMKRLQRMDQNSINMPYIFAHMGWTHQQANLLKKQEAMIANRDSFRSQHLNPAGIKIFVDGVPVPPKPTHVPLDEHGEIDETNLQISQDLLRKKLIEWDHAGLRLKMHAAGEGSVRVALNAIEATRKANGDSGIWHEVVHTSDVSPADMGRFKSLRAAAEVSPYFWHMPGPMGAVGYQFKTLLDNGALMTAGSDYNVVESFNPFPPLQGIVTRPNNEAIDLHSALAMFTTNPAKVIARSQDFGSIKAGRVANMVILDRNLFEIDKNDIGGTQVLTTILDGVEVYRK
ncbi:amidohydrolase [Pseudoteredinibacter isoporae]|uniref:Amidohydrolase 3 domain-containing protein n=1 Tax=Pseudoteredinibacter isoporae TaxID=570281 RepID=A0A7X0JQ36_9GAMM|nr:amidohydrolase [Pseudoteredinibacter isoporae]MBB6520227.1 hypothetical protein [Pseudoteredinibacter isoporae]NHO85799.1 amidohydrolase [Pseudoteredinibacter isoporae]NIB25749.1 amidohydrolase [Pseudoteredinibacter isoporae]